MYKMQQIKRDDGGLMKKTWNKQKLDEIYRGITEINDSSSEHLKKKSEEKRDYIVRSRI